MLSNGGLLVPSECIVNWILDSEHEFRAFSEYFQNCPGVSSILTQKILTKHPSIDPLVVKEFIQTRIRIKIKALNNLRRDSASRKRKAKQFANSCPK